MLNKIKANIEKYNLLSETDNVIVGFSGGADSALLVYSLKKLGYNVVAVHVHHGIRGEEADRDLLFSQKFCKEYNVTFFSEKCDIPSIAKDQGTSLETAARQKRYEILNSYALKFDAKIAVAHNKNDQAETVLMHLLRGSGLNGLCGIQFKNDNIIRPLLNISRDEIENFNKENSIKYIIDSTNESLEYTRNRIRLDIIPRLCETFSVDAVENIYKCAETLNEYNCFINETVDLYEKKYIYDENGKTFIKQNSLPKIINIELIKRAILRQKNSLVDIEKVHLEDVFLLFSKESGKEICLPHSITAKKIYDTICFFENFDSFNAEYIFEPTKNYKWKKYYISSTFSKEYIKEKNCEYLDFDTLPSNIVLRTRREGDYIYPLGASGKCSLKKYLIDKKIPADIRYELPLIALGSEIYAILGYTVSEKAKITADTKTILKIFLKDD